jgi:hypothetical protein
VDTGSSLKILNYSSANSGVIVDLTGLLENRAIKGKTITLKIYAKGVIEDSKLYAVANIKSKSANIKKENSVTLDEDKWKGIELLKLDIPANVQELTLDIATEHNGEIMIDAFTMTSN